MAFASLRAVTPHLRQPAALASRVRRGSLAGLLLALLALFAQIAAATPLPPAAPDQPSTVLGIAVPMCGLAPHPDRPIPASEQHDHLPSCAGCLCCHAPALLPAAAPPAPLPVAIDYAARIVLPPTAAPPERMAARPPPRAPPSLSSRSD